MSARTHKEVIMDFHKEYYRSEFIQHEILRERRSIEEEFSYYIAVAEGDIEYVTENIKAHTFINPNGAGILSDNPLQNMRYHFVISTAMISRYCVNSGMEQDKAYGLSDFYIRKMDKCKSIHEIEEVHQSMSLDFCNKMLLLKKSQIVSKPIVLCMDYIYSHIHHRITVKELAQHVNLSESYLSKLFSKEIGVPISEYIALQKVEKAKNFLCYSDYSITDIANYLAFSSQSHFIQVFQKYAGLTPHKYRDRHFRNNWEDNFMKK